MKDSFNVMLMKVASNIDKYEPYYNVQHSLTCLAEYNDKRGAIKYAFCKNGIYYINEAYVLLKNLMEHRKGHEIRMVLSRELVDAKSYQGSWVQLVYQHLNDGSKIYALHPINTDILLHVLNTVNHAYLYCKRHDLNHHLADIQYTFAQDNLKRKGVKNVSFKQIIKEMNKESKDVEKAKVPF